MTQIRRTVSFGQQVIPYDVRFLASRKTLGIEVHPDGAVWVRAPKDCPESLIQERMQKRAGWISRQLTEFDRYKPRTPSRQYIGGETHLYLGRQYRLKVEKSDDPGVKLQRGQLIVTCPGQPEPALIQAQLHRWYLDRAHMVFADVLQSCLTHFKEASPPRIIVRAMRSRWGSLSPSGTITLNASLARAPRPCIEYVITHELCHLKFRDHDARFFKKLASIMPDWEARKKRLEESLL
ncbi:MAG: M48 family metallopeptidase [Pseudomonadota bacterium]